jgi:ketosteroid isomerase-like protein
MKPTVSKYKIPGCSWLWMLLIALAMSLTGCHHGGDSGGDSVTYRMSQYFPLSSAWETDKWTLFVDENDAVIDGVSTLAMTDTRDAKASFWTNDEYGLRLHGIWNPENQWSRFSQPILLADAFSAVGDRNETVYTQDGEQLVFSTQLTGVENITTAAGTHAGCLKFRIHVYPLVSSPDDYGYETLWLAKNVGFVKAQSDASIYLDLFAKPGETRQLISHHHTPTEFSDEELAVRQAYIQWVNYWNAENITGMTNLTHDDYYEKCRDKTAAIAYWNNFFADVDNYKRFVAIEDVDILGDNAYVFSEYQESYLEALKPEPTRRWGRSTVRLKQDASGEWKIFGNQFDVYPSFVSVYPRVTPSATTLGVPVEITDCATGDWPDTGDHIASVTLTGPPESEIVDFPMPWDPITGWNGFWWDFNIDSAESGFYTFKMVDVNGNALLYTDYLQMSAPLEMPVLAYPSDGASGMPAYVTFEWEPVAGANGYKLEAWDVATDVKVVSDETDQTAYSVMLAPDTTYEWRVRARYYDPNDGAEYDNESRSSYRSFTTAP